MALIFSWVKQISNKYKTSLKLFEINTLLKYFLSPQNKQQVTSSLQTGFSYSFMKYLLSLLNIFLKVERWLHITRASIDIQKCFEVSTDEIT